MWQLLHRLALLKQPSASRSDSVSVSGSVTHCIVWLYSSVWHRCTVWPYSGNRLSHDSVSVCLRQCVASLYRLALLRQPSVSRSISVSVCLCQCVASLHRLALLRQPSVSRSVSVSVCLCQCVAVIASCGLTQANVCLTLRVNVSVFQCLALIASCGFTQANVCDTVPLSVSVNVSVAVCGSYRISVSVSLPGIHCIVWPYSNQRLFHGLSQCQCVFVSACHLSLLSQSLCLS